MATKNLFLAHFHNHFSFLFSKKTPQLFMLISVLFTEKNVWFPPAALASAGRGRGRRHRAGPTTGMGWVGAGNETKPWVAGGEDPACVGRQIKI